MSKCSPYLEGIHFSIDKDNKIAIEQPTEYPDHIEFHPIDNNVDYNKVVTILEHNKKGIYFRSSYNPRLWEVVKKTYDVNTLHYVLIYLHGLLPNSTAAGRAIIVQPKMLKKQTKDKIIHSHILAQKDVDNIKDSLKESLDKSNDKDTNGKNKSAGELVNGSVPTPNEKPGGNEGTQPQLLIGEIGETADKDTDASHKPQSPYEKTSVEGLNGSATSKEKDESNETSHIESDKSNKDTDVAIIQFYYEKQGIELFHLDDKKKNDIEKKKMLEVIKKIKSNPEAKIHLVGFADNSVKTGTKEEFVGAVNCGYSWARVKKVRQYLINLLEKYDLNNILYLYWYGNSKAEGKGGDSESRRVDIIISEKERNETDYFDDPTLKKYEEELKNCDKEECCIKGVILDREFPSEKIYIEHWGN
jgi:outer membrane protein OmpA-like peptidoglycan-associated protein